MNNYKSESFEIENIDIDTVKITDKRFNRERVIFIDGGDFECILSGLFSIRFGV